MWEGSSVLRQLSRRDSCSSSVSRSWSKRVPKSCVTEETTLTHEWDCEWWDWEDSLELTVINGVNDITRKKVMVLVDGSREAKIATLWALCYLLNCVDTLALLHVFDSSRTTSKCKPDLSRRRYAQGCDLVNSMRALCRARRPEVEVEAMVMQGEKGSTIVSQAKKLQVSILIMGQRKPSLFRRFLRSKKEELIEYCIENAECLTLAVRKQSSGIGGYVINSRWHKDFWLLA